MRIGYIHLDYGEWTNGTYNAQEIGLAQAFESLGHKVYILSLIHISEPTRP